MKWYVGFILIFCLFSCNQKDGYNRYLNEQLEANFSSSELNNYNHIVIIPRRGCHACIASVEHLFFEFKMNQEYLFIFTRIISKKKLKLEISEENLKLKNVKIDMKDIFYNLDFHDSAYPLMLNKQKNGKFEYQKISVN